MRITVYSIQRESPSHSVGAVAGKKDFPLKFFGEKFPVRLSFWFEAYEHDAKPKHPESEAQDGRSGEGSLASRRCIGDCDSTATKECG